MILNTSALYLTPPPHRWARTYFFITTLPSNTFGWNKHSQGYSFQNGNFAQFYVNIVILGRPALQQAPFCLFLIILTQHRARQGSSQYF